jgi:hypothetical protein
MRKTALLILLLAVLFCARASAYDERDIIQFVAEYKPYGESTQTIPEISSIYADAVFDTFEPKDIDIWPLGGGRYAVSIVSSVGDPKKDMLEYSPRLARQDILASKSELHLVWLVDMGQKSIRPYNYLAQDCLNLFVEMRRLLGTTPAQQ